MMVLRNRVIIWLFIGGLFTGAVHAQDDTPEAEMRRQRVEAAIAALALNGLGGPQEVAINGPMLIPADPAAALNFAYDVDMDGDTILIGAPSDDRNGDPNSGAAYIFFWNGSAWAQQAKLLASEQIDNSNMGTSVSISGDTAVGGAPYRSIPSETKSGAADVFVRSGSTWTQQASIIPPYTSNLHTGFGGTVAIDGDTLAISADALTVVQNGNQYQLSGKVFIYTRSGTTWTLQAELIASNYDTVYRFGHSLDLEGDTLVVGTNSTNRVGSAYVFRRNGVTWTEEARLTPTVSLPVTVSDRFGWDVALDGDWLVVGAYGDDRRVNNLNYPDAGSVYVFHYNGSSWQQEYVLGDPIPSSYAYFGRSVTIENTLVAGGGHGVVTLFQLSDGRWQYPSRFFANGYIHFGDSLDIQGDQLLVGAPETTVSGLVSAGAAGIFPLVPGADIGVFVAASPEPVDAGEPLGYGIRVRNYGPDMAASAALTVTLPSQIFDLMIQLPDGVNCDLDVLVLTCPLGVLQPGADLTIGISAIADYVSENITLSAALTNTVYDPYLFNNTAEKAVEVLAPLNAPMIIDPADASTFSGERPTLRWSSVPGATRYEVQLGASEALRSIIYDGTATNFTLLNPLLPENTFYWRLRAYNLNGSSPWRSASFNVISANNAAPRLNYALTDTREVTLMWSDLTWATQYDVEVANNPVMSSPFYAETVNDVMAPLIVPTYGVYYWRVRGRNGTTTGAWSAIQQMTIDSP